MTSLAELVKARRQALNMTQEELAERVGVDRSYIGHIESKRMRFPSEDILRGLSNTLNVPMDELAAAAYEAPRGQRPRPDRSPQEIIRELDAALRREQQQVPIMVPETVGRASMGAGSTVEPEYWPYWPGPEERNHKFIAVPVVGDCMEPNIREGERVITDIDASPRAGDTVVAEHEGEHVVKLLEQRVDGLWLIARKNRPPLKIGDKTRIVGVVRMVSHRP